MKGFAYIAIISTLLFVACKKEDSIRPVNSDAKDYVAIDTTSKAVFVINEGNFQWGNSSITHYNLENKEVTQGVFQGANNGLALGDIAQSMVIYDNKGFIVVDNSNKIEVVEIDSFSSVGTITGLVAPRYIQIINSTKAYVTDLYADYITIFDPSTLSVIGQVNIPGYTEEMVLVNSKVYVTNMDTSSVYGNRVYVIDATTDLEITNFPVSESPNSVVLDKDNKVWVLSSGGYEKEIPTLVQIDPATDAIMQTFSFPSILDSPNRLKINGTGDTLYYLDTDIYRMSIYDLALPNTEFVSGSSHMFYGLGVDPNGGHVYASDAIDYVQQGKVFIYESASGTLVNSFDTGIIPGYFTFK